MEKPAVPTMNLRDRARVDTLQVIVKEETPFLPKVAFTLITLASLGGATFTGLSLGLGGYGILFRWLTLWSIALAGGFLVWRLFYLRATEHEVDQERVDALNDSYLERADFVSRVTGAIVLAGSAGALAVPVLVTEPITKWTLVGGSVILGLALLNGVRDKRTAWSALIVFGGLVVLWAHVDVGGQWSTPVLVRSLHLTAFALWIGGALWNIFVAMPAGRLHPNVEAVLAGARQLDRFRWVVRFSLPTIIVTGVIMAWNFADAPLTFWTTFPGVLIPLKVVAIVALVVVFITCPLFRHCSPVQGVCDISDLDEDAKAQ